MDVRGRRILPLTLTRPPRPRVSLAGLFRSAYIPTISLPVPATPLQGATAPHQSFPGANCPRHIPRIAHAGFLNSPPIPASFTHKKMGTKGRSSPRIVCCAIPIARAAGKVLLITSRKRPDRWVCECAFRFASFRVAFAHAVIACVAVPKGGWEASDVRLETAASREALEEGPTFVPLPLLLS
jgi:hypothetical protein